MQTTDEVSAVESVIGYVFENKSLIEQALTNESYVNENGGTGNERLEFLGDALLNFIVAEHLYRTESENEGVLTRHRAETVSRSPLSKAVDDMGLIKFYRLGKGAKKNVDDISEKFKSNIFESVLGAIYLDGGMKAAVAFVKGKLLDKNYRADEDYKSKLNVIASDCPPQYNTYAAGSEWESTVTVFGNTFVGCGRKKADAERQAAKCAVESLREKK